MANPTTKNAWIDFKTGLQRETPNWSQVVVNVAKWRQVTFLRRSMTFYDATCPGKKATDIVMACWKMSEIVIWKKGDPHPQDNIQHLNFTRTPSRFTTRPLPVYFTTKMSVVRPFSVFSKDKKWPLVKRAVFLVRLKSWGWGSFPPFCCETFFPLTAFKNARNPKLVQNLSQRLFLGVPVRGPKVWKNNCQNLSENDGFTNFDNFFFILGPLTGTPQKQALGQILDKFGVPGVIECCKGKKVSQPFWVMSSFLVIPFPPPPFGFRRLRFTLSPMLPFVRIHSGNNSKIIFLCICICYGKPIIFKTIFICWVAPSKLQRTAASVSAMKNEFQNNFRLYLYLL